MPPQPPRNGVYLGEFARANVAERVAELVTNLNELTHRLDNVRMARGDRDWRRDMLTVAQRAEVKAATKRVRRAIREWK